MMHITMPKVAIWQYLWLEATTLIDCEFQDFTTFGQVCPRCFASACATCPTSENGRCCLPLGLLSAQSGYHLYLRFCRDCIEASSSTATYMANV